MLSDFNLTPSLVSQVSLGADRTLPDCFRDVVNSCADAIALASDTWRPTYRELNNSSNRLANAFIARGGSPGDRIAILMQHDTPAIASLLAIMKAGRIVVALNATDPPQRLRKLIENAEPALIITDSANRALADEIATSGCAVLGFEETRTFQIFDDPLVAVSPALTAVLPYTSGSIASPKAVMMTHRQYMCNAISHTQAMSYTSADRLPLFGALSSGQAVTVLCSALINGATLYPFPVATRGITGLAHWIVNNGINIYVSSASIFRSFMKTLEDGFVFSGVRAVRLLSESATSDDFRQFQKHFPEHCVFVHGLSGSETGNIAFRRYTKHTQVAEGRLPVGHLFEGHDEVMLLDENGQRVVHGEIGEIAVRSRYVAAGYWRNPALTADRFSEDLDGNGTRLVRTGDLGRINSEGLLEFAGRSDDRIKLRGNRIELADIEHALHRLRGIDRAVVEAIAQTGREPVLVGFVIAQAAESWSAVDLRRALRAMLPRHMVPSQFVFLEAFPFTPSGKIDRQKIRELHVPNCGGAQGQAAQTETERMLADIWAEAFELPDIGRRDDFFGLGGDSLLAAVVAARVHATVGVELNLGTFADYPSLERLAAVIDELQSKKAPGLPPSAPTKRKGRAPLSLYQERTWTYSQTLAGSSGYTMARAYRIVGQLDTALLHECMSMIAKRHEIMRTTISVEKGRPVQIVHPPEPAPLEYIDLSGLPDPERQAMRYCRGEAERGFDITGDRLVRFALLRLGDNEYWLWRAAHHIICDVLSWKLYFDELSLLYEARLKGSPVPLSELASYQFGDYAVWQRQDLNPQGQSYRSAVAWWKNELAGAPRSIRLPFERNKPVQGVAPAEGILLWGIDPSTSRRLDALARTNCATPYMVRLAAFAALLADETGEREIVFATLVNNRRRLELQTTLGYFVNHAMLRMCGDPSKSFGEWLAVVRTKLAGVESMSEIPIEPLRDELRKLGTAPPEIQVIFAPSGTPDRFTIADLEVTILDRIFPVMPWGFSMRINEYNEEHGCRVDFNAYLHDPAGVHTFVERYKRLLDAVSRHPELSVGDLLAMTRTATQ